MTCPFIALMRTTASASSSTGMIVCCLSLSFASGGIIVLVVFIILVILVIPLVILVIPLMVPLDIDIDIIVIRFLELIPVTFNFSKPPNSLQLTVFFKLLIDDCDEDRKEVLRLVRSEDVDGANSDRMSVSQSMSCCSWKDNYTMVIR
jgi:hypothetical protein